MHDAQQDCVKVARNYRLQDIQLLMQRDPFKVAFAAL
jgi:hypothetical protein